MPVLIQDSGRMCDPWRLLFAGEFVRNGRYLGRAENSLYLPLRIVRGALYLI